MMKCNSITNRTKLVDTPIVEMILSNKYSKSGIKFLKPSTDDQNCTDIVYYSNGVKRGLIIKRNASKHYRAFSFSLNINKNKMDCYDGNTFVFIDEVSDCLYIVDGIVLLNYILEHADNVKQSDNGDNYYIIIPKSDILLQMIPDKSSGVIKYNKSIARLFAMGRKEYNYIDLV